LRFSSENADLDHKIQLSCLCCPYQRTAAFQFCTEIFSRLFEESCALLILVLLLRKTSYKFYVTLAFFLHFTDSTLHIFDHCSRCFMVVNACVYYSPTPKFYSKFTPNLNNTSSLVKCFDQKHTLLCCVRHRIQHNFMILPTGQHTPHTTSVNSNKYN